MSNFDKPFKSPNLTAKPKSKSRLHIVLASVSIIVLLIAGVLMWTIVAVAGVFVAGCAKTEIELGRATAALRQQLDDIKSPSYEVDYIEVYPNSNCMSGTGANGHVSLRVSNGTAAAVYKKLMTETFQVSNPDLKDLKVSMSGGDYQIGGMQTEITHKGQQYTVRFDLPKPIDCVGFDQTRLCGDEQDRAQAYDLYDQPVEEIIISSFKGIDS